MSEKSQTATPKAEQAVLLIITAAWVGFIISLIVTWAVQRPGIPDTIGWLGPMLLAITALGPMLAEVAKRFQKSPVPRKNGEQ